MAAPRKLLYGIAFLLVFGALNAIGFLYYTAQSEPPEPLSRKKTQATTEKQSTLVSLPGASPVRLPAESFANIDSLWLLVSKDKPLTDPNYVPSDLRIPKVLVRTDKTADEQSLRNVVATQVEALFAAAAEQGHDLMVASGFRSYGLQKTYYDNYVRAYGVESASKFSAQPGQSEHQTGLALDISLANRDCYLDVCFSETPAGKWLASNAHLYGFTLRYPENKTEVTKYQFEPWHFRYVGNELAKALYDSGLTLDEATPYFEAALGQTKL